MKEKDKQPSRPVFRFKRDLDTPRSRVKYRYIEGTKNADMCPFLCSGDDEIWVTKNELADSSERD